jgi:serine/threonine protein kinase
MGKCFWSAKSTVDQQQANLIFSTTGKWKGSVPIPDQSFETREWRLDGEDRHLFLNFLRRMLRWMPEERPTARELAYDDFLMQAISVANVSVSSPT